MPSQGRLSQERVVDPVLTSLLFGYTNAEFVGNQLFPYVPTVKEAGYVPMFGKEAFLNLNTERALRSASNEIPVEARSSFHFDLTEHDAAYPMDYREAEEDILNLETYAAMRAQSAVLLRHEILASALATNAANYSANNKIDLSAKGNFKFSNYLQSTPLDIVNVGQQAIKQGIVKEANMMIISGYVWYKIRRHPALLEMVKYTQRGVLTHDLVADLFNVKPENFFVADAMVSDDAGNLTYVWGNNIVIAYVAPMANNAQRTYFEPTFGYTFRKDGFPQADKYFKDGGKVQFVRATDLFESAILGQNAAYLIENCI
jgi:hypothetical protein